MAADIKINPISGVIGVINLVAQKVIFTDKVTGGFSYQVRTHGEIILTSRETRTKKPKKVPVWIGFKRGNSMVRMTEFVAAHVSAIQMDKI